MQFTVKSFKSAVTALVLAATALGDTTYTTVTITPTLTASIFIGKDIYLTRYIFTNDDDILTTQTVQGSTVITTLTGLNTRAHPSTPATSPVATTLLYNSGAESDSSLGNVDRPRPPLIVTHASESLALESSKAIGNLESHKSVEASKLKAEAIATADAAASRLASSTTSRAVNGELIDGKPAGTGVSTSSSTADDDDVLDVGFLTKADGDGDDEGGDATSVPTLTSEDGSNNDSGNQGTTTTPATPVASLSKDGDESVEKGTSTTSTPHLFTSPRSGEPANKASDTSNTSPLSANSNTVPITSAYPQNPAPSTSRRQTTISGTPVMLEYIINYTYECSTPIPVCSNQ